MPTIKRSFLSLCFGFLCLYVMASYKPSAKVYELQNIQRFSVLPLEYQHTFLFQENQTWMAKEIKLNQSDSIYNDWLEALKMGLSGNTIGVLEQYSKVFDHAKNDLSQIHWHWLFAHINALIDNPKEALLHANLANKIAQRQDNYNVQFMGLSRLYQLEVYYQLYHSALQHQSVLLEIQTAINWEKDLRFLQVYNDLALVYHAKGNQGQALLYLQNALDLYRWNILQINPEVYFRIKENMLFCMPKNNMDSYRTQVLDLHKERKKSGLKPERIYDLYYSHVLLNTDSFLEVETGLKELSDSNILATHADYNFLFRKIQRQYDKARGNWNSVVFYNDLMYKGKTNSLMGSWSYKIQEAALLLDRFYSVKNEKNWTYAYKAYYNLWNAFNKREGLKPIGKNQMAESQSIYTSLMDLLLSDQRAIALDSSAAMATLLCYQRDGQYALKDKIYFDWNGYAQQTNNRRINALKAYLLQNIGQKNYLQTSWKNELLLLQDKEKESQKNIPIWDIKLLRANLSEGEVICFFALNDNYLTKIKITGDTIFTEGKLLSVSDITLLNKTLAFDAAIGKEALQGLYALFFEGNFKLNRNQKTIILSNAKINALAYEAFMDEEGLYLIEKQPLFFLSDFKDWLKNKSIQLKDPIFGSITTTASQDNTEWQNLKRILLETINCIDHIWSDFSVNPNIDISRERILFITDLEAQQMDSCWGMIKGLSSDKNKANLVVAQSNFEGIPHPNSAVSRNWIQSNNPLNIQAYYKVLQDFWKHSIEGENYAVAMRNAKINFIETSNKEEKLNWHQWASIQYFGHPDSIEISGYFWWTVLVIGLLFFAISLARNI